MSITWQTPAGNLGTFPERIIVEIPLAATSTIGSVNYKIIAGKLPTGLRLSGNLIKGSPVEVNKFTTSKFVIRASDGTDIEDRTFSISVDGSDSPEWITKEGFLNVGQGENYFVLDNAYVNFRLSAIDPDITAGDKLEFYQISTGGQLPPGLSLSKDGVISGFTDPIFSVEYNNRTGAYDTAGFDISPLDVYQAKSNGFDTFFYDTFTYDYSEESTTPRRLSRAYTFVVAVSDGVHEVRRIFKIWVVTEEFLKSDNNIIQIDTNLFRADNSAFRSPIWITESHLGRFRANNFITIYLDVYDPPSLPGTMSYFLLDRNPGTYRIKETGQTTQGNYELSGDVPSFKYNLRDNWSASFTYNAGDAVIYSDADDSTIVNRTWVCLVKNKNVEPTEGIYWTKLNVSVADQTFTIVNQSLWETVEPETVSRIPQGMTLDNLTGEIAGRVGYQRAISKRYQFTMRAINFPPELASTTFQIVGDWNSNTTYQDGEVVRYQDLIYICLRTNRNILPINVEFWEPLVSTSEKTFVLDIVGEIESSILWITDTDIGSIKPNQPSLLFVQAEGLNKKSSIVYELESGQLPPGLFLSATGTIQGKVKQFSDANGPGLTRFYETASDDSSSERTFTTTFDQSQTSFNRKFKFKIKARDTANFSESVREFVITIISDNTKTFANLYLKAFPNKAKRLEWYNFITDLNIFRSSEVYRYGDKNFGVQTELKVLLFGGIESVEAVKYVQAMSRNHYRKQLRFGNIKYALGKNLNTQETLYEVIYIEIVDEYEKNGKSISSVIELPNKIESKVLISYDSIKVDSDIPFVSDSDHQRIFPNSFKNMRSRIRSVGERDREFLPLWMRSIQPDAPIESGYVKALVLCYTKPGFAETVISRIRSSGFDFKSIDFTADRFVIDVIDGQLEDKYLAFPQRGEKLP